MKGNKIKQYPKNTYCKTLHNMSVEAGEQIVEDNYERYAPHYVHKKTVQEE